MKILFKLTSRSRPHKLFECINNIRDAAAGTDYHIHLTLDENDRFCNTEFVRRMITDKPNLSFTYGYSKSKIDAFNRDMDKIPVNWDVVVATSDDIYFYPEAANRIAWDVYTSGKGVIHYGDGFEHGLILTVPIFTKAYYQKKGYIYHPAYTSLFCDEEAIITADLEGEIYYSTGKVLRHNHPAWGAGVMDRQYQMTQSFYTHDKAVFEQRKAKGFPV